MAKLVAVVGCTLQYSATDTSTGQVLPPTPALTKVKGEGKYAIIDSITSTVTVTVPNFPPTPFPFTINGSSKKAKSQNKPFVLEGDEASVEGTVTNGTASFKFSGKVKVTNAGQTKFKVE